MTVLTQGKISYTLYPGKIYLNITNRCSNNCIFCLRNYTDELGGNLLWLSYEPDVEEIINSIQGEINMNGKINEIIFCGYGEPMYRPDVILAVLKRVKKMYPGVEFRLNTNGQGLLINNKDYLSEFRGLLDSISISLNGHNAKIYQKICNSEFGEDGFYSMLDFTKKAIDYIPEVTLTVVGKNNFDSIGLEYPVNTQKCYEIACSIGAKFRIR